MTLSPTTSRFTQSAADALYLAKSLADAKGDTLVATAADTWARLPVGANDEVYTADSGEAGGIDWAAGGGGGGQLAYAEITNTVTVTATAEATPNDIVSSGAVVYAAARICVEFYSPRVKVGGTAGSFTLLNLWDDATDITRLAVCSHASGTQPVEQPVYVAHFLTPSAGTHTYRIRAWRVNSDGAVEAGAGTAGVNVPAFIRVSLAPS